MPAQPTRGGNWDAWGAAVHTAAARVNNLGIINVKDYGATGNGTIDDTSAIQAAWTASGGRIYFPAGIYVYNGTGLSGYADPSVTGEGRGSTWIILGSTSRLINGNEAWNSLNATGLTFSGGVGVIRNQYTGSNVAGHHVVERCTFLDYTGTAIASNATDIPYWKIHNNQFRAVAAYTDSKGVALAGAIDQSSIEGNSFLRNRVHVHLQYSANARIVGNDFIRWTGTAPSPRVDVWIQPGVVNATAGCEITGNKFGAENTVAGDRRILFADATTGTGIHDRFPVLTADSTNEVSGVNVHDNIVANLGAAPLPFVYSTTPFLAGSHFSGQIVGAEPTYIVQFRTGPGDSTRLSTNTFGPFQHTAGYTSVESTSTTIALTNAVGDMGTLDDPVAIFSDSLALPTPGGQDIAHFVRFSPSVASWLNGSGITSAPTTDVLGGTDATEVTYTSFVTSSSYYIELTSGIIPGRPLWLELDIGAGSTDSVSEVAFTVGPGAYGAPAFRRFLRVPASGWRRYRFRWTPQTAGPYYPAVMWATGSTGTKVKVGRPRIYHGQEPVAATPAMPHATTTTTAPAAGGAGALPATPAGYVTVHIAGTARKIPYY